MKLKELKEGDYFTFKSLGGAEAKETQVYIKEEYDRSEKKYWCQKWNDISSGRYVDGNKTIYTDFTF